MSVFFAFSGLRPCLDPVITFAVFSPCLISYDVYFTRLKRLCRLSRYLLGFPLKRVKQKKIKKTVSRFRQSRSSATVWIFWFAPPYNITPQLDDDGAYNDFKITVWSISNCRNARVFFLRRFAHLVKRSRQYLLLHQRFVRASYCYRARL